MPKRTSKVLLAAGLVLAAAACTPEGGTAGPTTSAATTTSASSTGVADAPKVAKPLDTSKWQSSPCTVLTDAQVATFGFSAKGRVTTAASGPSCAWNVLDDDTKPNLAVGFVTANTAGLSALYSKHQKGLMPILNKLPDIDGYPAVVYSSDPGSIQGGICNVAVGVTDQLDVSFDVIVSEGPSKPNACNIAVQLAEAGMGTMTGRS